MLLTREQITNRLLALPNELLQAELAYALAVQAQEKREAVAVVAGEVNGSNEMQRKAHLALLVEELEQHTAQCRIALHLLQNEKDCLRSIARLLGGEE